MRFDAENKGLRRDGKLFFPRVNFDEFAYRFLPVVSVLQDEPEDRQKVWRRPPNLLGCGGFAL